MILAESKTGKTRRRLNDDAAREGCLEPIGVISRSRRLSSMRTIREEADMPAAFRSMSATEVPSRPSASPRDASRYQLFNTRQSVMCLHRYRHVGRRRRIGFDNKHCSAPVAAADISRTSRLRWLSGIGNRRRWATWDALGRVKDQVAVRQRRQGPMDGARHKFTENDNR